MSESLWQTVGRTPDLDAGCVHVWRAWLDPATETLDAYGALLSDDERARADRFKFDHLRRRFTAARGALRRLLGGYLLRDPGSIEFEYGRHGKPTLADGAVHFNASHSGDMALFAFSRDAELGVDVERVTRLRGADAIAERHFAPGEFAAYLSLDVDLRDEAFYQCWTRKEAFIKAIGDGIQFGLDRFEVAFGPGQPARLVTVHGDADEAASWRMESFRPAPEFEAAIAARADFRPQLWSLDELALPERDA